MGIKYNIGLSRSHIVQKIKTGNKLQLKSKSHISYNTTKYIYRQCFPVKNNICK